MWWGSFSTSGPTVAVLTTLPYVDDDGVASVTARKSGAGGSVTASSLVALTGLTAMGASLMSEPFVSEAFWSPAHTTRYSLPLPAGPGAAGAAGACVEALAGAFTFGALSPRTRW